MRAEPLEVETQEADGLSEAHVQCMTLRLIQGGVNIRSLSTDLRGRIVDLLRGRMVTSPESDDGLIDDADVGASVPGAVEMAAMRVIALKKSTRGLMGMKRWKVERLFKDIISSVRS